MTHETEMTDAAVVGAVLNGQREMYRILVRRYQDVLYRQAFRMLKSSDEAAELVQRTLVKAYQRLPDCRNPERFGGWLYRTLTNLGKDYLKSPRRSDLSIEGSEAVIVVEDEGPEVDAGRAELRSRIREAIAELSDDLREAFVLKHLDGRSYDEMCDMLGASKSALKMRVLRAREELQVHLEAYR